MSDEKLKNIYQKLYSSEWVSLFDDIGDNKILDFVQGDESKTPANRYQNTQARELLKEALEKLPEKEYLIISLYYYEEMSQKEIASVMEVSPSRVSQLHKKAIFRLRGSLSQKKDEIVAGLPG